MIIILESYQPGYNSSLHYVSSLGVGTTALTYNISIILFGISVVLSSLILYKYLDLKIFNILLLLTGIFIIGVGMFPENARPFHGYMTAFTFIFGVGSAILSYKVLNPPISYISIILGSISLVLLIVFFPYVGLPAESTTTFLGLGKGTMERILIYVLMFWIVSFSLSLTK
jgi:hypothetical membrane protein